MAEKLSAVSSLLLSMSFRGFFKSNSPNIPARTPPNCWVNSPVSVPAMVPAMVLLLLKITPAGEVLDLFIAAGVTTIVGLDVSLDILVTLRARRAHNTTELRLLVRSSLLALNRRVGFGDLPKFALGGNITV